jgi:serine/threonine-protein kinase
MGMILYDPIPRITDRDSSLPPEIEEFWQRAINRDRELRFQSAKELSDALAETAMLERREIPTLPPRPSLTTTFGDAEHASLPPMSHTIGSGMYGHPGSCPNLSDASDIDLETGAPVSNTRRSALPTLRELTPKQRKLAFVTGIAALALIAVGLSLALGGGSGVGAHAAGDTADAPVSEPAAPPVPAVAPRLAEAPAAPASPQPSISATAAAARERELDEEQKKKDKKKRTGSAAPAGPAGSPDYGI